MIALRTILVGLALSIADPSGLAGSPQDLKATINELAPRTRRAAPEWIDVTLSSRSTLLREGALEFTMFEWSEPIYRYRTHELVINSGDQRFRFLLPAATSAGTNSNRTLELRLIEKSGTTTIGAFPLAARQKEARSHVIAVIRPGFRLPGTESYPIWQALRLERLAPAEGGPEFDTTPVFLDPSDVPNDALGLCAYDMVLIEVGTMEKIREKGRAALYQWVNAGGSLCVMANSGLDSQLVDSINTLAGVDPRWQPLKMNDDGKVQVEDGVAFARVNFGRFAITTDSPKDDPEQVPPLWRKISAYLWKMRAEQAAIVEAEGKWNLPASHGAARVGPPPAAAPAIPGLDPIPGAIPLAPIYRQEYRSVFSVPNPPIKELMPNSVRVLPLWILASLMGLFVILVGPGDWFVLGALKRRRLTWLAFPLVASLITGATVYAVQRYMGSATQRRSLIVTDIGVSGRVIRETRIDLELPAREGTAVTRGTNTFCVPVVAEGYYSRNSSGEAWTDIEFRGQYPARYEYLRPQRQWTPAMMRRTTIADAPDTSGIRWQAFDPKRIAGRWAGFLESEMSPGVACAFDFLAGGSERSSGDGPISSQWRRSITAMHPTGLGALLTQESPSGFSELYDLPIVESRDPSRTVLVAAKVEGQDIHIWRRLYLH